MRIRRYTASGNSASDKQEPVKLKINIPVNTPASEIQSAATEEKDSDTPKPALTPKPTKRPTPKPVRISTPKSTPKEKKVLAIEDEQQNEDNEKVEDREEEANASKKKLPLASMFLLVVGALMLSYGGFYIFRELRIKYKKKNEEKAK